MPEIKFISLLDLINNYSDHVEFIKLQYLLLLTELTTTNNIETSLFVNNVVRIHDIGEIVVGITSAPDDVDFQIVASGTIIIEPKIIRNGKNVGHIEDIVVSKHMRGKGVSQEILKQLKNIAKNNNCYKVILDCDDNVKNVYMKNGFQIKGLQMAEYF